MVLLNEYCPICQVKLDKYNINRKKWLQDKPIKLDYAGRAVCTKCAEWIENTEWD